MNNSKLVNVLRTFSKTEMKDFEKLVSSPFFNRGRNYLPFLRELKKFYPKFDDSKMTPEYIFSKIYRGKKFNRQIIWNMNSALVKMAEEFLMHVSLKKNSFERNRRIAEEFLIRKMSVYYYKKLIEMGKALDRLAFDENYFANKVNLEGDLADYYFFEDKQHLATDILVTRGGLTVLNFLKTISGIISDINANIFMYNPKYEFNLSYEFLRNLDLQSVIDYTKRNNYTYADIMEMYYCYIKTVLEPEKTEFFFRLKSLFEENFRKFDRETNNTWVNALSNYCVIKGPGNNDYDFNKIQFEIHKFQLENQIAFQEHNLSKTLFIQILKSSLKLGEIEWAKQYIEEYAPRLHSAYQKTTKALAYAYLYRKTKDYDIVLENLGKVKFVDVMDKLNVKSLYIMTYYERGDIETLIYQIDSTRHLINKNRGIGEKICFCYIVFLSNVNKLLALKEKNDSVEIDLFKKSLKNDKTLYFRDWLIEMAGNINP